MKWFSNKRGETRVIKKYAWFPIRIYSRWREPEVEWRWLETVKIEQEYELVNIDSTVLQEIKGYFLGGYWVNKRFIELDISEKRDEKLKKLGI